MKFDFNHSRFQKSLKCKDCFTYSDKVYHSVRYDVNLCVTCLMLRIKEDIKED
jgi:hypothetical protein